MHDNLRTDQDKVDFKNGLREFARKILEERMQITRQLMDNAQEDANGEDKSSAGDKYETARAMSHLEKEMHARQWKAQQQELLALLKIDTNTLHQRPEAGACIICGSTIFFLAAGLGKQSVSGRSVFFLSPQAPLALQLMQKKKGEAVSLNTDEHIITQIF